MDWNTWYLSLGSLLLLVVAGHCYTTMNRHANLSWSDTSLGIGLLLMSFILFDILRLNPSRHHTFRSLFSLYLQHKIFSIYVLFSRKRFQASLKDMRRSQDELLLDILHVNKNTKYGQDHKFDEILGIDDLRSKHQLTTYANYTSYINDILNGQDNILFPDKVDFIAVTLGTTSGKSKLFPKSVKALRQHGRDAQMMVRDTLLAFPGMNQLRFWHDVRVRPLKSRTENGIPKAAVSSLAPPPLPFYASPPVVYDIHTEAECLYLHALFGMKNEDIAFMGFLTSPLALNFLSIIDNNWKTLCTDLEKGQLNENVNIQNDLRLLIEEKLGRNPERAQQLRAIFTQGVHDIVPRIWPHCKVISAAGTGTFSFATEILKRKYLGCVPIVSLMHVATESLYGVDVDAQTSSGNHYTVLPSINVYEFLPVECLDDPAPQTLLPHQVKVGGQYEIVVTTHSGLYRYRTQDIVQITGFKYQAPTYIFIQRAGDALNSHTEKFDECTFTQAVMAAAKNWSSASLFSYIVTENIHVEHIFDKHSGTCFYYVFIELLEDEPKLSKEDKDQIDEKMMSSQESYCRLRAVQGALQPPTVMS